MPVSVTWAPDRAGDHEITVVPNDPEPGDAGLVLCEAPATARRALFVLDVGLYPSWNLISSAANPFAGDTTIVQRSIAGSYSVIQGFDGGALSYYPDLPPEVNTLKRMDGEHGYWVKVTGAGALAASDEAEEEPDDDPAVALMMIGERLPEDHPLSLDAGWNLISYLPRRSLPVAQALVNIDGLYSAVLGFEGEARSYYPDLDPVFNTLERMRPGYGYWIRMDQPSTLQYSVTFGYSRIPVGGTMASGEVRPQAAVDSEPGPTNTWVNFYGPAKDSEGVPLPAGATVQAIDPDGIVCGAVEITVEGLYGLLPCYGDDPTTPEDEGAQAGDVIQLVVDDKLLGQGLWTAHGERHWRSLGELGLWQLYMPLIRRGAH
jgi:hypothetical protein